MSPGGGGFDVEDMRRRCAAHAGWASEHPDAVQFIEVWANRNLEALQQLSVARQETRPSEP